MMHPIGIRRLWIAVCVLVSAVASPAQSEVPGLLVQLESPEIKAGGSATIHLVALNPSPVVATRIFPETVHGTLVIGLAPEEITFTASGVVRPEGVPVVAHGFARVSYTAAVPESANGAAELRIEVEGSPAFQVRIAAEVGDTEPGVDSEAAPRKFSVTEAKKSGTTETSFFRQHMFPYEPVYFIAGPESPNAKFQISFKYRLVNTATDADGKAEGWLYRKAPWSEGLHLAYTQLSLWDLSGDSAPFFDSNYMPELFYERPNLIDPETGWLERIGAQVGYQHTSNGMGGSDSRSMNRAYLRLPFVFGNEDRFYVLLEPQTWFYVGDLSDNPDIAYYLGYVDLKLKAGWADGLQVTGQFGAGEEFNKGSVQVDVTYPMHNLLSRSFSIYLQAQYFNGYGETLLTYDQRTEAWRIGIGLFR